MLVSQNSMQTVIHVFNEVSFIPDTIYSLVLRLLIKMKAFLMDQYLTYRYSQFPNLCLLLYSGYTRKKQSSTIFQVYYDSNMLLLLHKYLYKLAQVGIVRGCPNPVHSFLQQQHIFTLWMLYRQHFFNLNGTL